MLIGCHGSGHFGEARKNMNYTARTVCLKDPIILSYQSNITYQQNIISRVINSFPKGRPVLISHLDPNAHSTQEFYLGIFLGQCF